MAPDLPYHGRELTLAEASKPLGASLDDGFVVVSRELANAAKVGERELARRRRKIADRCRARNRRK